MCPFEPPEDLNAQRPAIVALWHERQKLAAEVEELRKKLEDAQAAKTKGKGKKSKSERRGRTGHQPPPAEPKPPAEGHGPTEQPHLPVRDVVCDVDEADKHCKACGLLMPEWLDHEDLSELIDVEERTFVRRRIKAKKYRCRCGDCLETAIGPERLLSGGRYSVNFAIEIAHDKYLLHSPLERQAREMTRQGLVIDSQTLWDQLFALGQLLAPAYHALRRYVLSDDWVSADETTWQLLAHKYTPASIKPGEWYAWIAHREDAAFYLLRPTRDDKAAEALLLVPELDAAGLAKVDEKENPVGVPYQGKVMCDAWWAYKHVAKNRTGLILVHCWAHVRREFVGCEAGYPEQAKQILDLIAKLYGIEKQAPKGRRGDAERLLLRQTESRAVLTQIEAWVWTNALQSPPASALRKAIQYLVNQWVGLGRFVDDPKLPLDNNATERDCRQAVQGKKNHYGSRSESGLRTAEIFYTLVQSAKLSGVEPKMYLKLAAARAKRGERVLLPHEVKAEDLREILGVSEAEARRALAGREEKES